MLATTLAALGGAVFGGLEWRRIARRHAELTIETVLKHARHLIGVVPIAVGLLLVQAITIVFPDTTWNAPVWIELHYTSVVLGGSAACISFLFGLATFGAFVTRHRHRFAALVSWFVLVFVVLAVQRDVTAPIADRFHERMVGDVVLQSTGASCTAASAANLARLHGIVRSERDMAVLLGTSEYGTTPAQLIAGLARLGFECRKAFFEIRAASSIETPAVLFYPPGDLYSVAHTVLLERVEHDVAIIRDPLVGTVKLNPEELRARWQGHAVECEPPPPPLARHTW